MIDETILGGAERGKTRPRGFADWKPREETNDLLEVVRAVLIEYHDYLPLTLRQVFYRLVGAHGYDKTEKAYKNLGEVLNRARRARLIDMGAIRDDGLMRKDPFAFEEGIPQFKATVRDMVSGYRLDRTEGQETKLMLWCEAAGMVLQIQRVADPYGVTVLSSGGFDSTTVKHDFARGCAYEDRPVTVLHVGDLDPSGVHMPLSLAEDVSAFAEAYGGEVIFHRLAVTPEQVIDLGLPSAPPKTTDGRAFTGQTTQAEAIAPDDLARIVEESILAHTDLDTYRRVLAREEAERAELADWLAR